MKCILMTRFIKNFLFSAGVMLLSAGANAQINDRDTVIPEYVPHVAAHIRG